MKNKNKGFTLIELLVVVKEVSKSVLKVIMMAKLEQILNLG